MNQTAYVPATAAHVRDMPVPIRGIVGRDVEHLQYCRAGPWQGKIVLDPEASGWVRAYLRHEAGENGSAADIRKRLDMSDDAFNRFVKDDRPIPFVNAYKIARRLKVGYYTQLLRQGQVWAESPQDAAAAREPWNAGHEIGDLLKPEEAALYRQNMRVYMAHTDTTREAISVKTGIPKNIITKALNGRRRKNLESYLAEKMANTIEMNGIREHVLAPQLLYADPMVRHFVEQPSGREYVQAVKDFMENGNGRIDGLIARLKPLLEQVREGEGYKPLTAKGLLSEEETAVFRSHLQIFMAFTNQSYGDICRKLGKDYNSYRQRLTGRKGKRLRRKEADRIAAAVKASAGQVAAPLLLEMEPSLRRYLAEDERHIRYIRALMEYKENSGHKLTDLLQELRKIKG